MIVAIRLGGTPGELNRVVAFGGCRDGKNSASENLYNSIRVRDGVGTI